MLCARLVLLTWQPVERNEFIHAILGALTVAGPVPVPPSDAPSPVALSDPARVRAVLSAAGFLDVEMQSVHQPMNFGASPEEAFSYLSRQHAGMIGDLDSDSRARAHERLRMSLAEHHTDQGVLYDSAAWLIHARVTRPWRSPCPAGTRRGRPSDTREFPGGSARMSGKS